MGGLHLAGLRKSDHTWRWTCTCTCKHTHAHIDVQAAESQYLELCVQGVLTFYCKFLRITQYLLQKLFQRRLWQCPLPMDFPDNRQYLPKTWRKRRSRRTLRRLMLLMLHTQLQQHQNIRLVCQWHCLATNLKTEQIFFLNTSTFWDINSFE